MLCSYTGRSALPSRVLTVYQSLEVQLYDTLDLYRAILPSYLL